ncbi:MAG TPA: hypothetical protein VHX14_13985, partial [Thermoanaerobaculia bacterium]|nr:hypothetical protein [Thermoanaerobaculia bacterium]
MSNGDQSTQSGTSERTRAALIIGTAVGLVFVILVLSAWIAQFFAEPVRIVFLVIVGILSLVGVVA